MTDHQTARRAAKSKAFFARLALRAAEAGDAREAERLLTWATRKRTVQRITQAVIRVDAAASAARAA